MVVSTGHCCLLLLAAAAAGILPAVLRWYLHPMVLIVSSHGLEPGAVDGLAHSIL